MVDIDRWEDNVHMVGYWPCVCKVGKDHTDRKSKQPLQLLRGSTGFRIPKKLNKKHGQSFNEVAEWAESLNIKKVRINIPKYKRT